MSFWDMIRNAKVGKDLEAAIEAYRRRYIRSAAAPEEATLDDVIRHSFEMEQRARHPQRMDFGPHADEERLYISIANPYDELGKKTGGSGIGLVSVGKRLRAHYGRKGSLRQVRKDGCFAFVGAHADEPGKERVIDGVAEFVCGALPGTMIDDLGVDHQAVHVKDHGLRQSCLRRS